MATSQVAAVATASATPNVKGSYSELTASTPFNINGIFIHLIGPGAGSAARATVDFATGGAGSETVLIADILLSQGGASRDCGSPGIYFPVSISSGTRLAVRCAASIGSATVGIQVTLIPGPLEPEPLSFATYGISGTNGVAIDPGAVVDTKGAWFEIVSLTAIVIRYLVVLLSQAADTGLNSASFAYDIGVGLPGSELVVIPNIFTTTNNGVDSLMLVQFPYIINIPVGSRIAARGASNNNIAGERVLEMAIIGCTHIPFP